MKAPSYAARELELGRRAVKAALTHLTRVRWAVYHREALLDLVDRQRRKLERLRAELREVPVR